MSLYNNNFAADSADHNQCRPAMFAGSFYTDKPELLKTQIDYYMDKAKTEQDFDCSAKNIRAIVVPHAGYTYSGSAAAHAYACLEGQNYDAVVVIAPSHRQAFKGSSVFSGDSYETPLGRAEVDTSTARMIASLDNNVKMSLDGHLAVGDRAEHSIEVQIPFIQTVLPDTPIIPICMGTQDNVSIHALVKSLTHMLKVSGKNILIVASTDLSHFHSVETAAAMDKALIKSFNSYDYFKMALKTQHREWDACGASAMITAMEVCEQINPVKSRALIYTNSSEAETSASDTSRVVGYFSGLIYEAAERKDPLPELSTEEKNILLKIAENTVRETAGAKAKYYIPKELPAVFEDEYPVFVTLKKGGQLRGCIGYTVSYCSLTDAVRDAARSACSRDPRFKPVQASELDELSFDISILSYMRRVIDPEEVQVGRDGVLLRNGSYSGLFLPQVPTEQGWDRRIYLEQLGRKAGLDTKAYLNPDAELFVFKAMVFNAD